MALADNQRLYDIATRSQLYVEGVKVWQARQFNFFVRQLAEELRKLLSRITYKRLDSLTKTQLNSFLVELRRTQSRFYTKYLDDLLKQFEDFMNVGATVTRRVYATEYMQGFADDEVEVFDNEQANELLDDDSPFPFVFGVAAAAGGSALWTKVNTTIIPANGLTLGAFLKGFSESAQAQVRNQVTKSYANGETLDELVDAVSSLSPQGTSGIASRIMRQGSAAIDTSLQHISQMVSASIVSGLYGRYAWYSLIDNGTTDICISRNLKIYTYGEGPIPPAHVLCRSHIAPVTGNEVPLRETFASWFKRQPAAFRADVGESNPYRSQPLTAQQYAGKVVLILSR